MCVRVTPTNPDDAGRTIRRTGASRACTTRASGPRPDEEPGRRTSRTLPGRRTGQPRAGQPRVAPSNRSRALRAQLVNLPHISAHDQDDHATVSASRSGVTWSWQEPRTGGSVVEVASRELDRTVPPPGQASPSIASRPSQRRLGSANLGAGACASPPRRRRRLGKPGAAPEGVAGAGPIGQLFWTIPSPACRQNPDWARTSNASSNAHAGTGRHSPK